MKEYLVSFSLQRLSGEIVDVRVKAEDKVAATARALESDQARAVLKDQWPQACRVVDLDSIKLVQATNGFGYQSAREPSHRRREKRAD